MANPRGGISFNEIQAEYTTYLIDGVSITYEAAVRNHTSFVGRAVSLSGNGTVKLAVDGEAIIGRLDLVEADGKCRVQDSGYMELPGGLAATLTRGTKVVGALGAAAAAGYIRSAAAATAADLLAGSGKIIDASDTTKVVVKM
jgi:hypothetical protein